MIFNPAIAIVCLAFALPRLTILALYGPVFFDDSADFTLYAERILAGTEWLYSPESGSGMPITYVRMPGYPLVVAGAKALSGEHFAYAVVALQTALSFTATLMLFAFARIALECRWKASAIASCFAITLSTLLDLSVLADSFVTSLYILIICSLGGILIGPRSIRWTQALALGIAAMSLLLLRGNGIIIAATLAPLAAVTVVNTRMEHSRKALCALLMVLPIIFSIWSFRTWNEHRSGIPFISTGAEHAAFQPLFKMSRAGHNPFDDPDHPLERTVRENAKDYLFTDIAGVISALHDEHGLTHPEITAWITGKYTSTLIAHPINLVRSVATGRHLKALLATVNPVATAVEIHQDISDFPLFPPLSDVIRSPFASLDLQQAVVALPYLLFAGLSLFVILAAAIGAPIAAARNGVTNPRSLLMITLWIAYGGIFMMYALIHLELRYVVCIAPIPALLTMMLLRARATHTEFDDKAASS